uniref:Uncharacterized protein n=2 Tax=Strongyloides stercoralis TaxID=6248 RepID=A0AAF5D246_STRER
MLITIIFYATIAIITLFNLTFGCSNRSNRKGKSDKNVPKKENGASAKKQKILQDIIPMEKNKPKRKCRRYATNKFHIRKNGSIKELATATSNYFLPSSLNSIQVKQREQRTLYGISDTVAFGKIKRFQKIFKDEDVVEEEDYRGIFTIVSKDYDNDKNIITLVSSNEKKPTVPEDDQMVAFIHKKRKIYGINTQNINK